MKGTCETGRTLTEMLGTLVIMSILTISFFIGFNYAMTKIETHRIYKDIKLVYISFFNQLTQTSVWQLVSFNGDSNKQFFIQRDKGNHDFIRVATVEQKVCQSLLEHVQDTQEMTLFSPDGTPLTCQAPEQEIIASFSGVSPLVVCDTGADCPDIYNVYCDASSKECKSCPWAQRADDSHNGCIDLCGDRTDGYTQSCGSDELQANWCCPEGYLCSDQVGMCLDDTVCLYEIGEVGEISYTTNCSYMIEPDGEISYKTNCSYTITDDNLTPIDDMCPDNYYCHVNWLDKTWKEGGERSISDGAYTGKIYGVCTEMASDPLAITVENLGELKPVDDICPDNYYCHVNWLDEAWEEGQERSISDSAYTGKIYGVCTETASDPSAIVVQDDQSITEKIGCIDDNQYCYLLWTDASFSQQISSGTYTGKAYGKCTLMTQNATSEPNATSGINQFENK